MRNRLITISVIVVLTGLTFIMAVQLGAFETKEMRVIPLSTVYATFNQEGLKSAEEMANNEDIARLPSALPEASQQIVLCVGKDVSAAVKASTTSFSIPADVPVPVVEVGADETLWVAAYLGSDGSVPPAYRIRIVEVQGKTIRVAFEREESSTRSADLRAYMIWAPVGRVEAGVYTLELFDAPADRITLSRPWHVTVK